MQSSGHRSLQEEEIEVLSVDHINLQQQFMNLQQDWETFKKSNPLTRKALERSHESSITTLSYLSSSTKYSNLMVKTLYLLDQTSPRSLVSSLQSKNNVHRRLMMTPDDYSEVREIVRCRREAIEGGSLKGRRRLFEAHEGFGDAHEVRSVVSFDESSGENDDVLGTGEIDDVSAVWVRRYSCSLPGERVVEGSEVLKKKEREKMVQKEMNAKGSSYENNNVALNRFFLLVVLGVLFAICVLGSFGLFSLGETNVILVPT